VVATPLDTYVSVVLYVLVESKSDKTFLTYYLTLFALRLLEISPHWSVGQRSRSRGCQNALPACVCRSKWLLRMSSLSDVLDRSLRTSPLLEHGKPNRHRDRRFTRQRYRWWEHGCWCWSSTAANQRVDGASERLHFTCTRPLHSHNQCRRLRRSPATRWD